MKKIIQATILSAMVLIVSSCACDGGCDSGFMLGVPFSFSAPGCTTNCCGCMNW